MTARILFRRLADQVMNPRLEPRLVFAPIAVGLPGLAADLLAVRGAPGVDGVVRGGKSRIRADEQRGRRRSGRRVHALNGALVRERRCDLDPEVRVDRIPTPFGMTVEEEIVPALDLRMPA